MGEVPIVGNLQELKESGLVGVGVLIVFISIIIVATVAAGVLINTGVSVRGQARDTAQKP